MRFVMGVSFDGGGGGDGTGRDGMVGCACGVFLARADGLSLCGALAPCLGFGCTALRKMRWGGMRFGEVWLLDLGVG